MAKRIPWDVQETESDSQEEAIVQDLKEQARFLKLEADISETGAKFMEENGVDQDIADQHKEKVPGKKETANELTFIAKILERTRNS